MDVLAQTLFLESDVDVAAFHTLRLDSYMKDGLCRHEKTLEAVTSYPDRFLGYVGVDPTARPRRLPARARRTACGHPGRRSGLSCTRPGRALPVWRMDDPDLAYPLFERAQERGIKTIAIHKAAPLGPVPMDPYRIDDVEGAAEAFPDLNFEIIHSGLAFTTETAWALARYPEPLRQLRDHLVADRQSAEDVRRRARRVPDVGRPGEARLLRRHAWSSTPSRSSSGSPSSCSRDETLRNLGIEQWDHEQKRLFLGGNYARITGLDIEAQKAGDRG